MEPATLPFVIPSAAEGSAVRPSGFPNAGVKVQTLKPYSVLRLYGTTKVKANREIVIRGLPEVIPLHGSYNSGEDGLFSTTDRK
jgi:hypothetical protein